MGTDQTARYVKAEEEEEEELGGEEVLACIWLCSKCQTF
jgi:hypothetical protein